MSGLSRWFGALCGRSACFAAAMTAGLVMVVDAAAQCRPQWSSVPTTGGGATAIGSWDEDGDGPAPPMLYVSGYMTTIGVDRGAQTTLNAIPKVGRMDGWDWYPVGEGFDLWPPDVLFGAAWDVLPSLRRLYAGSEVHYTQPVVGRGTVQWNARHWRGMATGMANGHPRAFVLFEEGNGRTLLAGGGMQLTNGDPTTRGIARWDGEEWSRVGRGVEDREYVWALCEFNDPHTHAEQPTLYVGGSFRTAGTIDAWRIARWDGQNWSKVGELGADQPVRALCVFDAGDGPMLYVGGAFSRVGGPSNWVTASRLARWNGREWSPVPGWSAPGGGAVYTMTVWDDDGDGPNKPALFIGGWFANAAGTGGRNIVKWDGQTWSGMDGGLVGFGDSCTGLHVYDDDHDGPNPGGLYAIGGFQWAGGIWSAGIARWGCPLTPPCLADCDFSTGFGVLDVFDFLCFANRFHAGAPYACDCDTSTGHGVCDIFDFLCFGQRFQRGCP